MIVVTGGLGFIGQNLVKELERRGAIDVVVLDIKNENLDSLHFWLLTHAREIDCVYHLGAITDTTVMDKNLFDEFNVMSSMFIWNVCAEYGIPLIYASSAATYGDGEEGFDDEKDILNLKPLNPYGWSKQQFDVWAIGQVKHPPFWYGLKFFNVYGYGEAHKGKMASVVFHAYNQIMETGELKLFKSHHPDYRDGEQKRDFIYVDDIVRTCEYMAFYKPESGIYNVGTGKARSFNDLAKAVFKCLGIPEKIKYIDIPIKIRDSYQYFTEARMNKMALTGIYSPHVACQKFNSLEDGVEKYIKKLQYENR